MGAFIMVEADSNAEAGSITGTTGGDGIRVSAMLCGNFISC